MLPIRRYAKIFAKYILATVWVIVFPGTPFPFWLYDSPIRHPVGPAGTTRVNVIEEGN
jgi:hypothetical protein